MNVSKSVLRRLPKTDLHLHLDGSLRLETLIELAREYEIDLPAYTPEGLKKTVFKPQYADLGEYLQGFQYTCGVMQTTQALHRVAYELAWDNINEGVRYIEVRFAPLLHTVKGLVTEDILKAVCAGLQQAGDEYNATEPIVSGEEPPFYFGIIACAMRMFNEHFPGWYGEFYRMFKQTKRKDLFELASLELVKECVRCRNEYNLPIVGFDLAGQEDGYPAKYHKKAFEYAHQNFLLKTVHAGEAFGPESIFEALNIAYADRLGHGYHLFSPDKIRTNKVRTQAQKEAYVESLIHYVSNRRLTIEVCISSNMQTNPEIPSVAAHHFGKMLAHKMSVSLCTDNRLVSHTTVTDEYALALEHFEIDAKQLRDIITYGFKRSFYAGTYLEKRRYIRQCIDYFDRIWAEEMSEK